MVLPTVMKGIVIKKIVKSYKDEDDVLNNCFEFREDLPMPKLKFGEVLIKVARSQINPSDTSFCQNRYGIKVELSDGKHVIPGFEGAGTVVSHGGNPYAWSLMGKKVAFFGKGVWSEYVAVDAFRVMVLHNSTSWANACGAIVNPMTVVAMIELAKETQAKTILCTAGASALVGQAIKYGNSNGIKTIAVVRKAEQVQDVLKLGAAAVLNSTDADFVEKLGAICKEMDCHICFDAVAGKAGSQCFAALQPKGTLYCYGFLSGEEYSMTGGDLIFKQKQLKGLWLSQYTNKLSVFQKWSLSKEIASKLDSEFSCKVSETFPLRDVPKALVNYTKDLSKGKVHITMEE